MTEKIRKTLFIHSWLADFLDDEGAKYDGPGVAFSAAVFTFANLPAKAKMEAIQAYRNEEVRRAYAGDVPAADPDNADFRLDRVVLPLAKSIAERVKKHPPKPHKSKPAG